MKNATYHKYEDIRDNIARFIFQYAEQTKDHTQYTCKNQTQEC